LVEAVVRTSPAYSLRGKVVPARCADLGNASFTFVFDSSVDASIVISATATDPDGNTSEFSAWVNVM
jgi:hypothetical protein